MRTPGGKKLPSRSRRAALREGFEPSMPPLPYGGDYLIEWLMDAGPSVAGGMGPEPMRHADIAAWQVNTGIACSAWEARTLRELSIAWTGESLAAREPEAPRPWVDIDEVRTDDHRARIAAGVRSLFRS